MRPLVLRIALLLTFAAGPLARTASAQSITGTSGLLFTPSAHVLPDGTGFVGAGWVDRSTAGYYDGTADYMPIVGSLVFLPGLELGLRFSRAFSDTPQALGDRMVLAKWQFLEEGPRRPAVAIGAHDFLRSTENSTNHFHSVYVVASKVVGAVAGRPVGVHLGFGSDLVDARGEELQGIFGGIEAAVTPFLRGIAEYDAQGVNVGLQFKPIQPITMVAGIRHLQSVTGGVYFVHRL